MVPYLGERILTLSSMYKQIISSRLEEGYQTVVRLDSIKFIDLEVFNL